MTPACYKPQSHIQISAHKYHGTIELNSIIFFKDQRVQLYPTSADDFDLGLPGGQAAASAFASSWHSAPKPSSPVLSITVPSAASTDTAESVVLCFVHDDTGDTT